MAKKSRDQVLLKMLRTPPQPNKAKASPATAQKSKKRPSQGRK